MSNTVFFLHWALGLWLLLADTRCSPLGMLCWETCSLLKSPLWVEPIFQHQQKQNNSSVVLIKDSRRVARVFRRGEGLSMAASGHYQPRLQRAPSHDSVMVVTVTVASFILFIYANYGFAKGRGLSRGGLRSWLTGNISAKL